MDFFNQSGEPSGPVDSKVWEVLARSDPASPAFLFLARSYLALGNPEGALETAQPVLTVHPGLLEASLVVARALVRLNRYEEAREVLGRAWAHLSTLAESLETLGSLLAFAGLPSEAARAQWAALALRAEEAPFEKQPALPFAALEEEAGPSRAVPTETLARLYLKQGHLDEAVEIYKFLLKQDPGDQALAAKLAELEGGPSEAEAPAGPPDLEEGPAMADGPSHAAATILTAEQALAEIAIEPVFEAAGPRTYTGPKPEEIIEEPTAVSSKGQVMTTDAVLAEIIQGLPDHQPALDETGGFACEAPTATEAKKRLFNRLTKLQKAAGKRRQAVGPQSIDFNQGA